MGVGKIYRGGGSSGGGVVSGDYIPTNQKGTPGGVSTLDGNGKVYKNQLNHLTASDVGALASFTETDPSVSQLIKEIVTVNDLLSKVNLASGNLSDSLFPFSINDYITISQKGVVNGVASLNINGLIPKNQINLTASDVNALPSSFTETDPSVPPLLKTISTAQDLLDVLNSAVGTLSTSLIPTSVDEILRYANVAVFPASGDVKKIYLEQENNRIYRWSGSSYIEISSAGIADTATKLATARTITFTGGDVAGSYNFDGSTNISTALTLATVNSTTGVFGNATQVPVITTNRKGLITNIETTTFTPAWGNITGIPLSISALVNNDGSSLNNINQASNALKLTNSRTISLTGDGNWSTSFDGSTNVTSTFILTTVNINTGTFGSATQIPTFTVNEKGLVTGVTNTTIAPNWNSITNLPTSISNILNNDGSLLNNIDASKITTGVISASVLPSYVDDFLTFADLASFPATGQTGKIYLAENTNISYRWTGVSYVDISSAGISDAAVKLNTPRTISITGDGTYSVSFDGSVNVTAALILATVNANVGAFGSATQVPTITVNAKGLVTGVTHTTITPDWSSIQGKPNNLAGYGITDAQPLGNELTALQNLADTAGFLKKTGDGSYSIDTSAYLPLTGGVVTGTVTATSFVGSGASLTNISAAQLTTARTIAATGDGSWSVSFDGTANVSAALTLTTVNSTTGTFGSATQAPVFVVDGKGRITQVSNITITPAWGSITGVPATLSTIAGLATTNKFVIIGNGTTWTIKQIDVSSDITGVLPVANGGTGSSAGQPTNRIMLSNFGSSSQLQWDFTNRYLGIGVGTPAYPLDVFGGGRMSGQLLLTNATASTSTTTGAEVISGGLGVAGAIYSGGGFNGSGAGLTDLNASNVTSGKMGYAFLNIAENATISNDNTPAGGTILTNLAAISGGYPYDNAHLFSVSHSASRGFQIINSISGANFSFRSRNGGAWTAWRQAITSYRDDGTGVFISTGGIGWTAATGTATRTTFATDTVTLIELARRVKALIDDLLSRGIIA